MKRIYLLLIAFLPVCVFGSLKNMDKKLHLAITPEKLELIVNQKTDPYTIAVDYMLHIPKGYLSPRERLVYIPHFAAQGHEYRLKPVVITGIESRNDRKSLQLEGEQPVDLTDARYLQAEEKDMEVRISDTIPFQLWMTQARFLATAVVQEKQKFRVSTDVLAEGVVYLPLAPGPVRINYVEKEVAKDGQAEFRIAYPANVSFIHPDFKDNLNQLNGLGNLLLKIANAPAMSVVRIVVTGICSPDGSLAYNERLAHKRINNFLRYLQQTSQVDGNLVVLKTIPQDWEGAWKMIDTSDFPGKKKALLILDSKRDALQKNTALRRLPDYAYLTDRIYPYLQSVNCTVYYTTKTIETVPEAE